MLVEFCSRKLIDFGLGRPVTAERKEIISTTSSHADPCSMFFFRGAFVCGISRICKDIDIQPLAHLCFAEREREQDRGMDLQ